MSRYSKNLSGQKQAVFVSPATAYSDSTTIAGFYTEAADGEIGVFMASGALKTTALAAGDQFFIAQKKNSEISKTPLLTYSDFNRRAKTVYSAPVKQVTTIGYNKTAAAGTLGLVLTGTGTKELIVQVRCTSPGNQPFPIEEANVAITNTTTNEYDALLQVINQLNNVFNYNKYEDDSFVVADIQSAGTVTEAASNVTVVLGSKTVTLASAATLATGTYYSIRNKVYKIATGVTAGTTFTLDRPYTGASETIVVASTVDQAGAIAYTDGTTELGIRLEGADVDTHFTVTVDGELESATITKETDWALGAGSGASIVALEKEGQIFAGIGSTANVEFKEDYGQPTAFAVSTTNYDQIFLELFPSIAPSAAAPNFRTQMIQRIILASPTGSGTSPNDELNTVFGV